MRALRIRRWIVRANVVLLAGVVCVGVVCVRGAQDLVGSAGTWEFSDGLLSARAPSAGTPGVDLDELLAMMASFMGRPPGTDWVARPTDLPPVDDAPLPLALFGLGMHMQNPSGPDLVLIRSKDPARPVRYLLKEGEITEGLRIEAIEDRVEGLRITIARGHERLVLERRRAVLGLEGPIRQSSVPVSPGVASKGDAARGAGDPGVRCVPYYDAQGRPAGLRVMGVDPHGPLAAAGLRAGDAILAVDGDALSDARDLVRRWRTQGAPHELVLQSTEAAELATRRVVLSP
jgi:hypothetical protein